VNISNVTRVFQITDLFRSLSIQNNLRSLRSSKFIIFAFFDAVLYIFFSADRTNLQTAACNLDLQSATVTLSSQNDGLVMRSTKLKLVNLLMNRFIAILHRDSQAHLQNSRENSGGPDATRGSRVATHIVASGSCWSNRIAGSRIK
jgi:hypothetical protein